MALSWASSIRTTSGEFAHYPKGSPIFSSRTPVLKMIATVLLRSPILAEFAVLSKTSAPAHPSQAGAITLEIQQVYTSADLHSFQISPPLLPNEYILSWDMHYVLESNIIAQSTNIVLDYVFADAKLTRQKQPPLLSGQFRIRRVIDTANIDSSNSGGRDIDVPVSQPQQQPRVSPLCHCHCHPSRAELELQVYGRGHLEAMDVSNGRRTICLPLYRWFRSVPERLPVLDGHVRYTRQPLLPRACPASQCLPNYAWSSWVQLPRRVDALKSLIILDKGIEISLFDSDEKVFFCAFTLAFLGDMPQQQENAGFKTQRANLGCRFCYIDHQKRSDLTYDTEANGRYHFQVKLTREEMEALGSKHQKEQFATKWDISVDQTPLVKVSPALDLILSVLETPLTRNIKVNQRYYPKVWAYGFNF